MFARRHVPHYLMVLPFMLLFAGFLPLSDPQRFTYSFFDWNAVSPARFVGLDNYQRIIASRDFQRRWEIS